MRLPNPKNVKFKFLAQNYVLVELLLNVMPTANSCDFRKLRLTSEVLMDSKTVPDDEEGCQEEEDSAENLDNDVADEGELHAVVPDINVTPGLQKIEEVILWR